MTDLKNKIIELEAKHVKYGDKRWLRKLFIARKKLELAETSEIQKKLLFLRQSFTTKSPRYLRWLNWRVKKKLANCYITKFVVSFLFNHYNLIQGYSWRV